MNLFDPQSAFLKLIDAYVRDGRVSFVDRAARRRTVGRGEAPEIVVRVHDPRMFRRALASGNLGLGEAFMDRDFTVDDEQLPAFLTLLLRARLDRRIRGDLCTLTRIAVIHVENRLRGGHANVRSHYDLYASFLDSTLTYSCGYATHEEVALEDLQQTKLARICAKLRLQEGERLLDIGCGYGGLLLHAAKHHGVRGVGISVSRQHAEVARARVAQAGLAERIHIEVADHRSLHERRDSFHKIVSVGMMEHLPRSEYRAYFDGIARLLAPGGLALLHAIGCNGPRNDHDPFIQRYVFPGSGQPRLSEITANLEARELPILDVENMIRHYAITLQRWRERFLANQHQLDAARYDARFRRMWDYYLSCGIAAARASDAALYQVLFTNDCMGPIPLERV